MGLDLQLYKVKPVKTIKQAKKIIDKEITDIHCIMKESDEYKVEAIRNNAQHFTAKDIRAEHLDFLIEDISDDEDIYIFTLREIDYQRKGLTDIGWEIIREIGNCIYMDDSEKVLRLCRDGGLNKSFYRKWNYDVVFQAWW